MDTYTSCELLSKFVTLHSQYNTFEIENFVGVVVNCFQNL